MQTRYSDPDCYRIAEDFTSLAREVGQHPAALAVAWVGAHPAVTAPIIGATKIGHLDDAIAAVDVTLSDDEISRLEAPYAPHPVKGMGPAALFRPSRRPRPS